MPDLTAQVSLIKKKPVTVRGIIWAGDNMESVQSFTGPEYFRPARPEEQRQDPAMTAAVYDKLHDTWVHVYDGDWVVQGVQGENYPVRSTVFPVTYDYLGPDDGRRG